MTDVPRTGVPQPARFLRVEVDISIAAAPARVWEALTDELSAWWPRDFLIAADRMQFEPRLGGRLFEENGAGRGAIWYTVYAIEPGASIDLAGHLSVAYGGPAQSLLRLELRASGEGTVLRVVDAVVGNVGDKSAETLPEGWRAIFDGGLRRYVEASAPGS